MDDMKDKMKGLMKKVNNPFSSSSSGKFKGQGRVLGGGGGSGGGGGGGSGGVSSSSSVPPIHPIITRQSKPNPPKTSSSSASTVQSKSNPRKSNSDHHKDQNPNLDNGFDPFDSLIHSAKQPPQNGVSLNVFECPICKQSFRSEEQVSLHVDTCVDSVKDAETTQETDNGLNSELASCIGSFVTGGASEGSIEIVLKLLRNVVKEPDNVKFRKIRMGNPKIREAIGDVVGGVELLECVGFKLQEEGDEIWAIMDVPSDEHILLIKEAISLLEPKDVKSLPSTTGNGKEANTPVEPQKIDRQVRVFFSVSESVAAKIDLPDSFYNLSADELKREADMRKKKIAESQLLIPKSYKEKQAKAARRRYKTTVIRIQFPDGVVLQGSFLPWEPTTALYEFVSSSLKEPGLEFELWHPVVLKRKMIPRFPGTGEKTSTLDDEDLVPAALVKFKPIETDSVVFTGLWNELLELSEPLK